MFILEVFIMIVAIFSAFFVIGAFGFILFKDYPNHVKELEKKHRENEKLTQEIDEIIDSINC